MTDRIENLKLLFKSFDQYGGKPNTQLDHLSTMTTICLQTRELIRLLEMAEGALTKIAENGPEEIDVWKVSDHALQSIAEFRKMGER